MPALPSLQIVSSLRSLALAFCWLALPAAGQSNVAVLPTPDIDPVSGADVAVLHRLADGRFMVGGSFVRLGDVAAPGCGRLLPDGSADAGFSCAISGARTFAEDAAGRVYVVGPSAFAVNRLLPSGALDPAFTPVSSDASIVSVVVAQGALYLGGAFSQIHGTPRTRLARLALDGTLDGSWAPSPDAGVSVLSAPGDGFLYVGGQFAAIDGVPRARLARLALGNGSVDGWDAGLVSSLSGFEVTALAHDASHLFVSGAFDSVQGQQRRRLAKLDRGPVATLDASWAPQVLSSGTQFAGPRLLKVIGDSVYVGDTLGMQIQSGMLLRSNRLLRLSRGGAAAIDVAFDPFGNPPGTSSNGPRDLVSGDGGGRLFVGGMFSELADGTVRLGLAALTSNGSADPLTALSEALRTATVAGLAFDPLSRSLYVQGDFRRVNGVLREGLVKLLPSGAIDSSFRPPASRYTAVALAGGAVYAADDEARQLRRLDAQSGDPDPGFAPIAYSQSINALVAGPEHLYLLGSFQLTGMQPPLTRLARMTLADGSIDTAFRFAPNAGGVISNLALDASGASILLFGSFTSVNGQALQNLARVDSVTLAIDADFAPAFNGPVTAATFDGLGGVWLSGGFTLVNGQTCRAPARLLLDGALDPSFSCNRSPIGVGPLVFDRDGVYGVFGSSLRRFALADGGAADPGWLVQGAPFGISLRILDGRLLVHGNFDLLANATRRSLAALPLVESVFSDGFE